MTTPPGIDVEVSDAHEAAEAKVGDLLAEWEAAQSRLEQLLVD